MHPYVFTNTLKYATCLFEAEFKVFRNGNKSARKSRLLYGGGSSMHISDFLISKLYFDKLDLK